MTCSCPLHLGALTPLYSAIGGLIEGEPQFSRRNRCALRQSSTTNAGDCAVLASGIHRRSRATQEVGVDQLRFDGLAIVVGPRSSCRSVLGSLAALGITGLLGEAAGAVCASPRHSVQLGQPDAMLLHRVLRCCTK
jgi:hypothetical protein